MFGLGGRKGGAGLTQLLFQRVDALARIRTEELHQAFGPVGTGRCEANGVAHVIGDDPGALLAAVLVRLGLHHTFQSTYGGGYGVRQLAGITRLTEAAEDERQQGRHVRIAHRFAGLGRGITRIMRSADAAQCANIWLVCPLGYSAGLGRGGPFEGTDTAGAMLRVVLLGNDGIRIPFLAFGVADTGGLLQCCLLYTSDAADE